MTSVPPRLTANLTAALPSTDAYARPCQSGERKLGRLQGSEPLCDAGSASSSVEKLAILDLGKAAKLLSDIAAVSHEADFSGIEVVAADAELLAATRQQVWVQAQV